jgi:hypothetical protein
MMLPETEKKVKKLVCELQHLYEERLISVCLYGSEAFREEMPRVKEKYQDINVLVVLKDLAQADLEKASSIGKWWNEAAHSLPLFFSEREWQASADVFALEYADIRDSHVLLHGKDLFSQVEIHDESLRLACELELSRKLVYLRQRMLLHRDHPKVLLELLQNSINSFAALFRGVLRLKFRGKAVPLKASDVFEALSGVVDDLDVKPFQRVLLSKEPNTQVRETEITLLFNQFIQQVSRVNIYVDQCLDVAVQKGGAS